jgi:CheY-like chemotaxis protein
VCAHSEGLGRGAEFVVALPLIPAPMPAAPATARRATTPPLDIVVVEDNEDAAETLADLLALGGHRVRTAGTGGSGVSTVRAERPDVVICDVGLPDMSGYDVVRAIRTAEEGGSRVFAVALTGYAQPQDRDQALAAGFDAHLPKPPPLEDLEALLAEANRRKTAAAAKPIS